MFLAATLLPAAQAGHHPRRYAKRLGALAIRQWRLPNHPHNSNWTRNGRRTGKYTVWPSGLETPQHRLRNFSFARPHLGLDLSTGLSGIPPRNHSHYFVRIAATDVRVRWAEHSADFHYRGIFAEHIARVFFRRVESGQRGLASTARNPQKTRRTHDKNAQSHPQKSVWISAVCVKI